MACLAAIAVMDWAPSPDIYDITWSLAISDDPAGVALSGSGGPGNGLQVRGVWALNEFAIPTAASCIMMNLRTRSARTGRLDHRGGRIGVQ